MKIAFTGHRNRIADRDTLLALADEFPAAVWAHGGAIGFDTQVAEVATERGILQQKHLPDYRKYGRGAPLARNRLIVNGADLLIACYDWRLKGGTAFTVRVAMEKGVPVRVLEPRKSDGNV